MHDDYQGDATFDTPHFGPNVNVAGSVGSPRPTPTSILLKRSSSTTTSNPGASWPRQWLAPAYTGQIPYLDFCAEADPAGAALAWMQAGYLRNQDLGGGKLWLWALLRTGPYAFSWYHRCHHIALDGYGGSTLASIAELAQDDAAYQVSGRQYWMEHLADKPDPFNLASGRMLGQTSYLAAARVEALRVLGRHAAAGADRSHRRVSVSGQRQRRHGAGHAAHGAPQRENAPAAGDGRQRHAAATGPWRPDAPGPAPPGLPR